MRLPCLSEGQVVVASGDVLLSFDQAKVAFSDSGVTGLAYPGSVEIASAHGVYVAPKTQSEGLLLKVADFLQKPTYDELERCNGLDAANRAFIDTGVMNFGPDAIKVLMEASGIALKDGKVIVEKDSLFENIINADLQLDIYKEIPYAFLGKTLSTDVAEVTETSGSGLNGLGYVKHQSNPFNQWEWYPDHGKFVDSLQKIPFFVNVLPYCEFFHVGTSKQLLRNFHTINYTASVYEFQNFSNSKTLDCLRLDGAFVYNSLINTASMKVNSPSLIEGCYLEGEILLEGENILTGIPKGVGDIKLQKGICVACVPVNKEESGWVSIIYGIEDDFKQAAKELSFSLSSLRHATTNATAAFLNDIVLGWMKDKGISPTDLWEDNDGFDTLRTQPKPHELWNARLFPFSTDPAESMRISLSLQRNWEGLEQFTSAFRRWRQSPRMSLREILESVDYERFLNNYFNLCKKVNLENLAIILTPKNYLSSEEILSWCAEADDYTTAVKDTLALFETKLKIGDLPPTTHHTHTSLASLSESLEDVAFELVREAIGKGLTLEHNQPRSLERGRQRLQMRTDEVVWVCSPARLDFAGARPPKYRCLWYKDS